MRSSMQRLVSAAVLITLASALSGCGGASSWDPSDLLDFLDTKKKLPGDRRPVFPEGVPGLEQGVPRDLYKESVERQQAEQAAAASAAAAAPAQPAAAPPSGRKAKSRSRGNVEVGTVRQDGAPDAASTEDGGASGVAPPPAGRKITRRRTTAPPPDAPAAAPAQQQQQPQSSGGFPAPMPSGSFSR
ncbi:MAG: hypothetical protein EON84_19135 [Bradyrhizobiaceae bacterium]|jgi:hypothetical protein|nr:MAG: hypothetical protein EON84_19135 [Bradyrhizobiaceae bacterium]